MLIVKEADPREEGPRILLEASHVLMQAMFPPEENYFLDIEDLCAPNITFFAARDGAMVIGTGALAAKDTYGEVKSMFTAPDARGRGVAAAILRAIEDAAREQAIPMLKLETGDPLKSAVRLYERAGFSRCDIFGDYVPNSSSVFMEKSLS